MFRCHKREGSTLVELVIGLAVAVIVVLLAVSHIARHQRAYDSVVSELELRSRLRDASDILTSDLRGASAAGDSILVALDTAVEFYSAIGSSTVCAVSSGSRAVFPPDSLPSGRVLSSWVTTPDTGDYVLVFNDSSAAGPASWRRDKIVAFTSVLTSGGCPASASLLGPSDVAGPGRSYEATVSRSIFTNAHRGSPVRFARRVRYSVYRGGDGKWYLGYRRCSIGCAAIQPVSGPYETRTGAPLSFRYFTRSGTALAGRGPTDDVARVEIVARGNYRRPVKLPGLTRPLASDSSVVTVTLRNRR